jgi:CheY-like chemotaxis protein
MQWEKRPMRTEPLVILLAEDDDGHAWLVERNLRRAGITNDIVRVRDGQEALDYVHRRGPHSARDASRPLLLLLDTCMPRIDGAEVLRQVKGSQSTETIPVIVVTVTGDPHEIDRCRQLGCSHYIIKPVEYDAFIEAVRRLGLCLQIVHTPV